MMSYIYCNRNVISSWQKEKCKILKFKLMIIGLLEKSLNQSNCLWIRLIQDNYLEKL